VATKNRKKAKLSIDPKALIEMAAPPPDATFELAPWLRTPKAPPVVEIAPTPEPPCEVAAQGVEISPEQRRKMIAEAAFRRALACGLGKSDPLNDWLCAEREVDSMLASHAAG